MRVWVPAGERLRYRLMLFRQLTWSIAGPAVCRPARWLEAEPPRRPPRLRRAENDSRAPWRAVRVIESPPHVPGLDQAANERGGKVRGTGACSGRCAERVSLQYTAGGKGCACEKDSGGLGEGTYRAADLVRAVFSAIIAFYTAQAHVDVWRSSGGGGPVFPSKTHWSSTVVRGRMQLGGAAGC